MIYYNFYITYYKIVLLEVRCLRFVAVLVLLVGKSGRSMPEPLSPEGPRPRPSTALEPQKVHEMLCL